MTKAVRAAYRSYAFDDLPLVPPIKVWKADQPVPQAIIDQAAKLVVPAGLRKDGGVDEGYLAKHRCLLTDGYVAMHDDYKMTTLMLIVRNDTASWVAARDVPPIKHQPVGTFVLLDIDYDHMLDVKYRSRSKSGVWVAAIVKEFDAWPDKQAVTAAVDGFFKQYQ